MTHLHNFISITVRLFGKEDLLMVKINFVVKEVKA